MGWATVRAPSSGHGGRYRVRRSGAGDGVGESDRASRRCRGPHSGGGGRSTRWLTRPCSVTSPGFGVADQPLIASRVNAANTHQIRVSRSHTGPNGAIARDRASGDAGYVQANRAKTSVSISSHSLLHKSARNECVYAKAHIFRYVLGYTSTSTCSRISVSIGEQVNGNRWRCQTSLPSTCRMESNFAPRGPSIRLNSTTPCRAVRTRRVSPTGMACSIEANKSSFRPPD